ncbi:MAG: serine hydrolase domain-containing protein, partial [Lysobacterales bacterium]
MNKTTTVLLVSAIATLLAGSALPGAAAEVDTHDQITRVENNLLPAVIIAGEPALNLQERMAHYKVPGVSIAVIEDFELIWSRQYGLADAELATPVTPSTQFNVGSLSKGVASLAVLSLVNDGLVQLDGEINGQLKSWQLPDSDFMRQADVTPRLLMNHSGGAIFMPGVSYPPGRSPTLIQVLNAEPPANTRPVVIDYVPGTKFQYSNAGYAVLQQLAVDAAGEPFETLARKRIFEPLQMDRSGFEQVLPQGAPGERCAGHERNGQPGDIKRYIYPIMAAGGLWSTAEDYARFVIELQKTYQGQPGKIISRSLATEMLSPQAARQYGLGVFMREKDGEIHYFGHMGDNRGFFAGYLAHLTDGHGVVVFTNSQAGAQLIREISRSVASVYGWQDYLPEARIPVPSSD